jgi:uncharacterized protein YoxC
MVLIGDIGMIISAIAIVVVTIYFIPLLGEIKQNKTVVVNKDKEDIYFNS